MAIEITKDPAGHWWGYKCCYMGEDAKILDLVFPEIVKKVEERNNITKKNP